MGRIHARTGGDSRSVVGDPLTAAGLWPAVISSRACLRVWMVGCGDEHVWDVAILTDCSTRRFTPLAGADWTLIVSENDGEVIHRAKLRRHAGVGADLVDAPYRVLYCQQAARPERLAVDREIYRRVHFVKLSPGGTMPPFEPFDLIVIGRFAQYPEMHLRLLLRPGGKLLALEEIWSRDCLVQEPVRLPSRAIAPNRAAV